MHQLVCKARYRGSERVYSGAPQRRVVPLDDNMLRRVKRVTDTLNRQGLRVVAVATKYLPAREGDYQRIDESDLIWEGYIAFLDPPKDHRRLTLKATESTVKILTGDGELVAAVYMRFGLDARRCRCGGDIEGLSDDALARR